MKRRRPLGPANTGVRKAWRQRHFPAPVQRNVPYSRQWNVQKSHPASVCGSDRQAGCAGSPLMAQQLTAGGQPLNAMTVDVEDYFQVSAFEPYVQRSSWPHIAGRVERNMDVILAMFAAADIKATFFTLGWIARRYPEMVRRIVDEGHELASHGWEHVKVSRQTRAQFGSDIQRTRELLEDISGSAVKGYRAASFSITRETDWAHDVLLEAGYLYSSSIAPITHDHYGIPDAPRFAHTRGNPGLPEIPVSTVRLAGRNVACGGGGWFRLYPYAVTRWAIRRVNNRDARPCVFYFHPWEIDPGQPRQPALDFTTRFRHYVGLAGTQSKIQALLGDFQWGRMDDIFLSAQTGASPADGRPEPAVRPN